MQQTLIATQTRAAAVKRSAPERVALVPLFANLSSEVLDRLQHETSIEQMPAKVTLLHEGRIPDSLYVLIDGLVQLFTGYDGHEATILILRPTALFPTEAVLYNDVPLISARTVQPSRIARIGADAVRRLFRENRDFAEAITNDLASSCRNMLRELKNMRARTAFQRLVAWILAMQAQSSTPSEFNLPFDKSVLAARLGMAPETLSRDFARLTALGVTVHGRKLSISNPNKLRQFAGNDELCEPSLP